MPLTSQPESRATPRQGMRYYMIGSAIVLALAICYVGWTFFSRWQQNRAIAEKAEKAAAAKRTQDQQTFQSMGGNSFEILGFYANPPAISRGDSASLCYSVSNAKSVTLDAALERARLAILRALRQRLALQNHHLHPHRHRRRRPHQVRPSHHRSPLIPRALSIVILSEVSRAFVCCRAAARPDTQSKNLSSM